MSRAYTGFILISRTTIHLLFFFTPPPTSQLYTLSLHDALPIYSPLRSFRRTVSQIAPAVCDDANLSSASSRSEEHTSELQLRFDLVCRLLLEKKKIRDGDRLQPAPRSSLPHH